MYSILVGIRIQIGFGLGNKENVALLKQARFQTNLEKLKKHEALEGSEIQDGDHGFPRPWHCRSPKILLNLT
jgi:hypothetical protein